MRRAFAGRAAALAVLCAAAALPAAAQSSAAQGAAKFRNLTAAEVSLLASGRTVFRRPASWKELSIPSDSPYYKDLEGEVRRSGHNYIGEVLLILPRPEAEALIPRLSSALLDFEGYAGIPYWSARNKKEYDLFDWVRVVEGPAASARTSAGSAKTLQLMEPFGEYSSAYQWNFRAASLEFSGTNTSPLSYEGVRAVQSGNLIWRLRAYREGDRWIFYGLGAVKAFDMFGALRERLSASFMGRIEAFFSYAYGGTAPR